MLMSTSLPALERDIFTVSRLNQAVRTLLEQGFSLIWLEGEISNLSRPASGHLYFSLKDPQAQVRCALFRNRALLRSARLENGLKVLVRARVSLYESRGDYQLLIEHIEEAGEGALRRSYDELRLRLQQEGLFDPVSKRSLPRFPRQVGIITSPTGAALRDVLSILRRRFPALNVLIYPVPVQGEQAGERIAQTLALASRRRDCDILLLVRGGGSLEDLWAFNEERVARAIHACTIPIVCGVGHETDVTIADFAADIRAPTPSAAAELVSPDRIEWLRKFTLLEERLNTAVRRRLTARGQDLNWLGQRLFRQHPKSRLQQLTQRLDELEQRLHHCMYQRLKHHHLRCTGLTARLRTQRPDRRIQQLQERLSALSQRLQTTMVQRLKDGTYRLGSTSRALHAVSPLQTLGRGYGIIRSYPGKEVIRRAEQVQVGEQVEALLSQGRLLCQVKEIK